MKIPTIKKLFSKTETPVIKNKVAVAQVVDTPKKTSAKQAVTKKVVTKKAVTKKIVSTPARVVKKSAVKKEVQTVATLKPVTKKVSPKKVVSSIKLVVASDSQSFWIQDGQILNSLPVLEVALKVMPAKLYQYHALTDGNHFADWVELVLGDKLCAAALRKAKTAKLAGLVVKKHLASLT